MTDQIKNWHSNGKLLLTGEYLVLEGAKALAIPLKYGQSLEIKPNNENYIYWKAVSPEGLWFDATINLPDMHLSKASDGQLGSRISDILKSAQKLSSGKLKRGFDVITRVDFDIKFGFGTSSTLISNIAYWLNINPYELLDDTFGGSGFDIACARHESPLFYSRKEDNIIVSEADFEPPFSDKLYFVYLGKKQVSSESISKFRKNGKFDNYTIKEISEITENIVEANTLFEFELVMEEHEQIMSNVLGLPVVQNIYFKDFPGMSKSLGAWGGDMVLMTNHESEKTFLERLSLKGFDMVFRFNEIAK